MGILEMLFGKKKPKFSERIWLTKQGKITDLMNHVRNDQKCGLQSVVVTHFQDTLNTLLEALNKEGVPLHIIKNSSQFPSGVPDMFNQKGQVLVLASEAIPSFVTRAVSSQPKNTALPPVSIHLAEHYPCLDRDHRVLDLDKVWPMKVEFTCYTSLDEPWLASFGVDRIREMLPKLGMSKEEVLEQPMLNQSIQVAQKKMTQQVPHEQICESCQEWVSKNVHHRS
jgi:hypothetical protein